ncbi:MAG: tetratricopeptide repeat protein [Candidatus Hydrogenedentota bacterium]
MSRKFWIISAISIAVLLFLLLASGGGYLLYRQYQTRQWLAEAEDAFATGDWDTAVHRYGFYLNRERDDIQTLEKYAEASLNREGTRRSNLSQAATAYRQILHYDPDNKDIEQALFDIQKKLGAWHEIHYLAGRMLEKDPDNVDLKHEQAYALDNIGNRNDAVAAYRELIDQKIAKPEAFGNLARLLREMNLTEQAQGILEQAVQTHPDDPKTYVIRAEYFLQEQDMAAVAKELNKAKALGSDHPDVLALEARFSLMSENYDTAVQSARAALEQDSGLARMYLVLAQALAEKGEHQASLDVLRNVAPEVRLDNPELFVRLAELLITQQKLDEAREIIAAYEKSYPNHQVPLNYLQGRVLLVEGDADAAVEHLSAVLEQNPSMSAARFFLGVANLLQGKPKEARNHLEIYLKENPTDENAHKLLREAKGLRADPQEIRAAARTVLGNESALPETILSSARALLASAMSEGTLASQLDTVESLFTRAIEQSPGEARAYAGLADAYIATNNLDQARETLQRAEESGVAFEALARTHANLALAEDNPDRAWECFEKNMTKQEASVEEVRQWSRFFSAHGQPDLARRSLTMGVEQLSGEAAKAELAVEQIAVALRLEEDEKALRLYNEVQLQVAGHKDAEAALNRVKEQLVWRLMERGGQRELEEARTILAQNVGDEENNSMLLTMEGIIHLRATPPALDEAETAFKKALEMDADSVSALMGMASVASLRGTLSQALEFASRAAEAASQSGAIDLWRAEILFRMQRYLEARDLLESVLSEMPNNVAALELLVNTYIATDQLREAAHTLERLRAGIEDDAQRSAIIEALQGRIMLAQGKAPDAEAVLRKQYEANPDDFSIVRALAAALAQQNSFAEAEEILKSYVEKHEKDAEAFVALARFYLSANEPSKADAASTALTRALVIDRDFLPALRVMVDLQVRRGSPASILAACDRYLKHDPLDAEVLFIKASVLSREPGREQEAREALEDAISQERRPDYLALRGMLHLREEQYAAALKDLQEASLQNPDTTAEFDAALAETYWGLEEKDLARTYYESAVRKAKENTSGTPPWLRRLEEKIGREN